MSNCTVEINYLTGNLFDGLDADQAAEVDESAVVERYEAAVRSFLPKYITSVTFTRQNATGSGGRVCVTFETPSDPCDIDQMIDQIRDEESVLIDVQRAEEQALGMCW